MGKKQTKKLSHDEVKTAEKHMHEDYKTSYYDL